MFNKKSAANTNTTGPLAELAAEASRLEEAGNWGDAAQVWQRIGSHKNASKKTRAEAKGRAAAARVRAEAKPSAESTEVEPTAGYYGDGARFLADIDAKRREMGIADHELIRSR